MSAPVLKSLAVVALTIGTVATFTACGSSSSNNDVQLQNIPTTAQAKGFTTLVTAVNAADLGPTLSGPGPFTVFAPSNAAFTALGPTLDTLLQPANKPTLAAILKYHVLAGQVLSPAAISAASGAGEVATVNGANILLDVVAGSLYVNNAKVGPIDVLATNGVIHGLDTVLIPPKSLVDTLVDRRFSKLVAAVTSAGLAPTLSGPGPFTVFAPTDAAFNAIASTTATLTTAQLANILKYHVVSGKVKASAAVTAAGTGSGVTTVNTQAGQFNLVGGALKVNNASTITTFNIPCTNGIIHVIDAVLIPPPTGAG